MECKVNVAFEFIKPEDILKEVELSKPYDENYDDEDDEKVHLPLSVSLTDEDDEEKKSTAFVFELRCDDDDKTAAIATTTNQISSNTYVPFGGGVDPHDSYRIRRKLICGHCDSMFKSRNTLDKHVVSQHLISFSFVCGICHYRRSEYVSVGPDGHYTLPSKAVPIICTYCHFQREILRIYCIVEITQRSLSKRHTCNYEASNKYKCGLCQYESESKKTVREHLSTHVIRKRHRCKFCGYKTAHECQYVEHFSEGGGRCCEYKCDDCGFEAIGKKDLKGHSRICPSKRSNNLLLGQTGPSDLSMLYVERFAASQSNSKNTDGLSCQLCGYKNKFKSLMRQHMLKHTGEKPYRCEMCGYRCQRKNMLNIHMAKHAGHEKPYECELCSYRTLYKSNVGKHMLIHAKVDEEGATTYACELCTFKSVRKENWQRHMRVHTGERPFGCSYCEYRCAQKSMLTRHMINHTGIKPYACHLCDYRSGRKDGLDQHLMRHAGYRPFACPHCEFSTTRKRDLNRHVERHIKNEEYMEQVRAHLLVVDDDRHDASY